RRVLPQHCPCVSCAPRGLRFHRRVCSRRCDGRPQDSGMKREGRTGMRFTKLGAAVTVSTLFAAIPLATRAQTAPTATQDPTTIDEQWQIASSKYDAARAAILKEVDAVSDQGPYRPDWESLQKYEVPEWYKDAKFGIFIHWGVYS